MSHATRDHVFSVLCLDASVRRTWASTDRSEWRWWGTGATRGLTATGWHKPRTSVGACGERSSSAVEHDRTTSSPINLSTHRNHSFTTELSCDQVSGKKMKDKFLVTPGKTLKNLIFWLQHSVLCIAFALVRCPPLVGGRVMRCTRCIPSVDLSRVNR